MPLISGATWSYENPDDPFDTYVESVFEEIEYEGDPAYRMGRDLDDHVILYREADVVTVYAIIEEGVVHDLTENIVLGDVQDGDIFRVCSPAGCDSSLIRLWADMDPALRSIYGLDPGLTDMVMFASYDPEYAPNLHNIVVESNLSPGAIPPIGAVTSLEWYLRSVGMVVIWDVDAESGGMMDRHDLVGVSAASEPPGADPLLLRNYPNPFNPVTTIVFELPGPSRVELRVYDVGGRLVRTLLDGVERPSGRGEGVWRGRDDTGVPVAAGVYVCELVAGEMRETRHLTLLK